MSALVEHAKAELARSGWLEGSDAQSGEAILNAVKAFSEGGWSGGSAPFGVRVLGDLLQFKPLGPLTNHPAEWQDVSAFCGGPTWQSRRRPDAFSQDGGKTYRLQEEARVRYDRWPWILWKLRLRERPPGFVRGSDFGKSPLHKSELSGEE